MRHALRNSRDTNSRGEKDAATGRQKTKKTRKDNEDDEDDPPEIPQEESGFPADDVDEDAEPRAQPQGWPMDCNDNEDRSDNEENGNDEDHGDSKERDDGEAPGNGEECDDEDEEEDLWARAVHKQHAIPDSDEETVVLSSPNHPTVRTSPSPTIRNTSPAPDSPSTSPIKPITKSDSSKKRIGNALNRESSWATHVHKELGGLNDEPPTKKARGNKPAPDLSALVPAAFADDGPQAGGSTLKITKAPTTATTAPRSRAPAANSKKAAGRPAKKAAQVNASEPAENTPTANPAATTSRPRPRPKMRPPPESDEFKQVLASRTAKEELIESIEAGNLGRATRGKGTKSSAGAINHPYFPLFIPSYAPVHLLKFL